MGWPKGVPHSKEMVWKRIASRRWGKLPAHEIVKRLMDTEATTRSLAAEFGCSDATIKVIFRRNSTSAERAESGRRKQAITVSIKNQGTTRAEWTGFSQPELARLRNSQPFRKWQTAVFDRDGRACVCCGASEGLDAHHIFPFAKYPYLRFAVGNGITLCRMICHELTRGFEFEFAAMFLAAIEFKRVPEKETVPLGSGSNRKERKV